MPLLVLGMTAPWVRGPSPSQELSPQETNIRRHQVSQRPGEGHQALQDFLASGVFRRFRSLRSMGLKAVGTEQSVWHGRRGRSGPPVPFLPLEALGPGPLCHTVSEGGGPSSPPPQHSPLARPLPPRSASPLTLQTGVRDLLHVLLHQAPLAA